MSRKGDYRREGGMPRETGPDRKELRDRLKRSLEDRNKRREVDRIIMQWRDPKDPGHREMHRREAEAKREFRGANKRAFCNEVGVEMHNEWMEKARRRESAAGRVENRDFLVNRKLRRPDGSNAIPDYADLKRNRLSDLKPIGSDETPQKVAKKYADQRARHIEGYQHATGRPVHDYTYHFYPSAKDIFKDNWKR